MNSYSYRAIPQGAYISHHGILGQKWGQRNGPPYPLGEGDHSAREKKEGYKKSLGGGRNEIKYGRKGASGDKNPSKKSNRNGTSKKTSKNNENGRKNVSGSQLADQQRAENTKAIKDTKGTSAALIAFGAAAVIGGGILAMKYGDDSDVLEMGMDLVLAGTFSAVMGAKALGSAKSMEKSRTHIQELANKSEFKTLNDIPKATKDYKKDYFENNEDPKELMNNINPGYPKPGSTMNCMMCTSAMIMRLKGYDVKAGKSTTGYENAAVEDWFKNAELKKFKSPDQSSVYDELKAQGDGSYGNLMVSWAFGGGHSILYTVRNGEVQFIDGQASTTYKPEEIFGYVDLTETYYCQLDNCDPNELARGLVERNN